jgi:hypothetical protein
VLKQKRLADGSEDKKKARLVAGGHRQTPDLYSDTYSPTALSISMKILLQLAASREYFMKTLDIASAFIRADIDRDVYVSIPAFGDHPAVTAKLKKSLYGLKQAGRLWYEDLKKTLIDFGARPSKFDPCVFIKEFEDGNVMYTCVHVDDLLVIASDESGPALLTEHLRRVYGEVTEADTTSHLGMTLQRDEVTGNIKVTQRGLINKIVEELGLTEGETKSVRTPAVPDSDDKSLSPVLDNSGKSFYASVVGMLLYLTHSRPDIAYAVSRLSARSHAPSQRDLEAVKRVGRYLLGTADKGIIYRKGDGNLWPHIYCDAAFANHEDGRSQGGYSVSLAPHSGPVYALSKKSSIVALSSTEAEVDILKNATTLAAWMKPFLAELGYESLRPIDVMEDNMAAIHLARTDGHWGRTRHFMVRYQYVRSQLEDHVIELHHVPTCDQVADIFTKSLDPTTFERLRDILLGEEENVFIQTFLNNNDI